MIHGQMTPEDTQKLAAGNCASGRISPADSTADLLDVNRHYYDSLWSGARLVEPHRFNTWPLVQSLSSSSVHRLEVAPGLRPRLPLKNTQFVDISSPALVKLRDHGASVVLGQVTALPFAGGCFDFVCALDIVEHVSDEDRALAELARVAKPGAALLLSVPLHPARWTVFDDIVGHCRRYEPARLLAKLAEHRLVVERSAVFGMQPRSSWLLELGMWWLAHHRERALWWYNRAIMPLGLRFQRTLEFATGMIDTNDVDEILVLCRKELADR